MRLVATMLIVICLAVQATAQPKLIHYGWDNPNVTDLPHVIQKLENSVFDGLAANSAGHDQFLSATRFTAESFESDFKALNKINPLSLSHSYLLLHAAAAPDFDWRDDLHWTASLSNVRQMAKLARTGGFKGIVFDMEPYGKSPWNYKTQTSADATDFSAFQNLLHRRGVDMMNVMQTEFPGIELWCLFGLSAHTYLLADPLSETDASSLLKEDGYGLWSSFFGGLIAAASEQTKIIDGNEPSYYYTTTEDFIKARSTLRNDLKRFLRPELRDKYRTTMSIGHAVYVDGIMNLHGSPRFIGYYFDSDRDRLELLARNTANALMTTESIVWVYSEKARWWDAAPPPSAIDTALRNAKNTAAKTAAIQPSAELVDAEKKLRARVTIHGAFRTTAGLGVKPESFGSAFNNMACSTWGDLGEYACEFPKGSTVILEPKASGQTFWPAKKVIEKLDAEIYGVNWTSITP